MSPETERAWAAGLFDGEGNTVPHGRRRNDGSKGFMKMCLSQKDTGPDILLRLQRAVEAGTVYERKDRPGVWVWHCTTMSGCKQALDRMWPYLSEPKKRQAERVGYDHSA